MIERAIADFRRIKEMGFETRRLLEVCRARRIPILTFINKFDREVREPLDILDEIERELFQ